MMHAAISEEAPVVLCYGSNDPRLIDVVLGAGLRHIACDTPQAVADFFDDGSANTCAVVCAIESNDAAVSLSLFESFKALAYRMVFWIVFGRTVASEPGLRLYMFSHGAHMITADMNSVDSVLQLLANQEGARRGKNAGSLSCAHCGMRGLNENILHRHLSLYHSTEPNIQAKCLLCGALPPANEGGLYVHFHNNHGPAEARDAPRPPFGAVVRVLCRHPDTGHYLFVHEPAGLARGAPRYWFPAGFLNKGESILAAACRETWEEAGIEIKVVGILSFMLPIGRAGVPCPRIVLLAEPAYPDGIPKSIPDFESVGAVWCSHDVSAELCSDAFRMSGLAELVARVHSGALTAQRLDTEAFSKIDSLFQRLTTNSQSLASGDLEELSSCWDQLRVAYPPEAFQES